MAATPARKSAIATSLLDRAGGGVVVNGCGATFFVFIFAMDTFNGCVVFVHCYRSGIRGIRAQSQSGAVEMVSHPPVSRSIRGMELYKGIRRDESRFAHLYRSNLFSKNRS
jgi:hypothetical protein